MQVKTSVFADSGALDPILTESDFRTGHEPGTLAKAENVNTFGFRSDEQLKIVSDELCQIITDQGVTINPNDSTQLSTIIKTKVGAGGAIMTGLLYRSYTSAPTLSGNTISFPAMTFLFNQTVYYGTAQNDFLKVSIIAQDMTSSASWPDGVNFIYVDSTGTLQRQTTPVLPSAGATKCYLGSVFVQDGNLQVGSWAFNPWLTVSAQTMRESPTATTKGGLLYAVADTTLGIGAIEVRFEGINFAAAPTQPNILSVPAANPFTYKFLYPDYDSTAAALDELDTTHLYNRTAGTWDDISAETGFIVMVPCITPTGQTLLIPAMSTVSGMTYNHIFETMEAASNAVFGLQYSLANVAARCMYFGYSFVVKVGATDLTDSDQFQIVGMLPEALTGFTDAGGSSAGGSGGFVPMLEVSHNGLNLTMTNQASNLVASQSSGTVQINLPTPSTGVLNQLEVKFTPDATNLQALSLSASLGIMITSL